MAAKARPRANGDGRADNRRSDDMRADRRVQPVTATDLLVDSAIAVEHLLTTFDDGQRRRACFVFDEHSGEQDSDDRYDDVRHDWHYVPRARPGLCLADLRAEQQKTVFHLLRTGTTASSYATACLVMALEDVLDDREGGSGPRRGRQHPWGRHRAEYHVAVFGAPGDHAWGWRVEGHHLSVNLTVVTGQPSIAVTPQFLGANPAQVDGAYRLLAPEQDLAIELVGAMTASERGRAIVDDVAPDDILTTNARSLLDGDGDGDGVLPPLDQGIAIGELQPGARPVADALVAHYASRLPDAPRPPCFATPHDVRFTFAGEPTPGRPHYYRLQGERLLVEYDNTQDGANHIHTVVRDQHGDFGDDLLARHRAAHH
jgi:hypothetical protein